MYDPAIHEPHHPDLLIVGTPEDILPAIKALMRGRGVLCRPCMRRLLEEQAKRAGLSLAFRDGGLYEEVYNAAH